MPAPPFPHAQTHWTQVDGIAMHSVWLSAGPESSGPVFVLVHGLGMSSRYMMPTAKLLAAAGSVHVPDLPGFGKSGKPARVLSISELADALALWLRQKQISAPVLIGNSLGAQVIADYAARYPSSASGIVLLAPTIDPGEPHRMVQLLRLLRDIFREPLSLYWIGMADYFKAGVWRIWRSLGLAIEHDICTTLARIRIPVLLICGERDPIIPASWMNTAAELVSSGRWVVIPGAAHAINFNAPEAVTSEVLKFVAGNSVQE